MAPNPADHTWWLASRASGVVAMILITASVFIGLTLSTRVLKGPGMSRWLSAAHEQAALGRPGRDRAPRRDAGGRPLPEARRARDRRAVRERLQAALGRDGHRRRLRR